MNSAGTSRQEANRLPEGSFYPRAFLQTALSNRRVQSWLAVLLACLLAVFAGRLLASRPVFVLGAMIGAVALAFLAARPRYVIFFVMTYTPFEEFLLRFVPSQAYALARYLPEMMLIAALAAILLAASVRRRSLRRSPMDLPILAFAGVSLVSIFYNRIPLFVGVLELRILLRYAVAYYILVQGNYERPFLERLFKLMLVVLGLQIALGLLQSALGERMTGLLAPRDVIIGNIFVRRGFFQLVSGHTRIFATMGRYNHYGNFLAFFLLFPAAILYLNGRIPSGMGRRKLLLLVFAGIAALVLSFSRMSWLGFYAGLVVMLLIIRKARVILYMVLPLAVTLLLFRFYGPEEAHEVSETTEANVLERYAGMFSRRYVEASLSGDRLFALTQTTSRVLNISPVFGLGPGSVASAAARVFGGGERWEILDLPASKVVALGDVGWAAILAQYGIAGLCAFLWMLKRMFTSSLGSFRRARDQLERAICLGFLGGFSCVIVENFFSFNFTYRASSLYFWLIAGIVARLGEMNREERISQGESAPVQHLPV